MIRRTLAQWKIIIDEQQTSGLNAVKYCDQNQLNYKTFSARKSVIKKHAGATPQLPGFLQLVSAASHNKSAKAAVTMPCEEHPFELLCGNSMLKLPATTCPKWLGTMLRELSV
jgi:hypothetical protein